MAVLSTMAEPEDWMTSRKHLGLSFLFGAKALEVLEVRHSQHRVELRRSPHVEDEAEDELRWQTSQVSAPSRSLALRGPRILDAFDPGPIDLRSLAALLPGAMAAHAGHLGGAGVVTACVPIAVPFSVPQVSPDSWLASKRARAFQRGVVLTVYTQGALALLKLSRGDLIGGLYDGSQSLMGAYATLLGLLQIFQGYQGVPLHYLPVLAVVPPCVALCGAYCGWQFCKELTAIAAGQNGVGPQDTCFVHFMGADWWPSFLGPNVPTREDRYRDWGRPGSAPNSSGRFSAFAGDGRRLGGESQ
eukprot:TRINITY_DN39429_c0_g1_i1.p1 TRINITY_DN39429_c0_g1~~TRINITY_DN39429_c0_g1_i1.p1  ORF type:complete len:302 (+),score=58.78 TRINITY_DN39429_c0_g1_i1:60-965(+)